MFECIFKTAASLQLYEENDARLEFVQNFGIMCFKMAGKQGNRVRQLPKDTASAIHNACMGT